MRASLYFIAVMAFSIFSGPSHADSIADTYTTGDTLTAEKMNNIKSAVNDNDTRITSLESAGAVADTLSGLSCADGQVAKFNGTNWTCADDIDTNTITQDTLSGLSCASGQVAKFNGTAWACGDDAATSADEISGVTAGAGLSGGGTSGTVTLSVDPTAVQSRISASCAAGESIRSIAQDGTVTCEPDTDTDTTYTAGAGISLTGTALSADVNVVQSRVSGTCPSGQSIREINENGTVTCEVDTDTDTTYTAGSGLSLSGTEFSYDAAPAFRVSMSAAQSVAQGDEDTLAFDTVAYDNKNAFNTTTHAYVIPESGFYQLTCSVLPSTTLAGANIRLYVGADMVQINPDWPGFQTITVTTSNFYNLGTSVDCRLLSNFAGSYGISANFNRFGGFMIR